VPDADSIAQLAAAGGIVSLTGPPGTLAIFDSNLLHGSNGNITPYPRSNVFLVYNSMHNTLVEPFGGGRPRPEFLACRKPQPLRGDGSVGDSG
jgi:ectoine hydroxylase